MTNLSERLDQHIQSIRETKEIDYKGTKVLIDPSRTELDQLFRDNKKVFGYVMSVFQGPDKPDKITNSIWYGITGREQYPGSIAYDLYKKFHFDWSTELEVDSKTREVEYCSSFSVSHEDGIEAGDGILSPKDAIAWAKLHKDIATKYDVKWLHNYKKYIDNWNKGRYADGSEVEEDLD